VIVANLFPYPEYQKSSVPWLDRVPKHWQTRQLRTLASEPIRNGVGESAQPFRPDWPRYIRITDIAGPRALRTNTRTSLPVETAARARVKEGDLLLAAVGATYGKSYLHRDAGTPACFAGYLVRLSPNADVRPEFLSYWTESAAYWDQVNSQVIQSTIQNFSAGRYKGLQVSLPPLPEQAAMVRFLDHADRRIRRYIAAKKKLIALLVEQKQAVLHRAVTRGFDPHVRLIPSGVEWLGDVPEHWSVMRNKAVMTPRRRTVGLRSTDFTLLSLTLRGVIPRDLDKPEGKFPADFGTYQAVEPNDLVFCLFDMDETPRTVGIAHERGMVTGAYSVFECLDEEVADFLYLFYLAMDAQKRLRPFYTGLRKVVQNDTFLTVKVAIPPQDELRRILTSVATEISRIDRAIERTEREVHLVSEYRVRLISDVVTGTFDVRDAAAQVPNEVDEPGPLDGVDALAEGDESEDETDLDGAAGEVEA
jgi:type I restriction enzyme, S subunit